jgi:mannan endo-1,4-beta-mannosidase
MRPRCMLSLALMASAFLSQMSAGYAFDRFVTVKDGMLMDGDKPYRFVSFNVPNLNYTEDDMRFRQINPYRLPTEYEMRDLFATITEMGGQAVRIYTVPVRSASFPADAPTYVVAPGKFDEESFRRLDLMLALANEYGVRIIFPLVNNWQWMGGRPNYAAFRGKDKKAFWTDPELIADFKATIRHVLERRNTITGTLYKDDKAILCWETGNELQAPFAWTVNITRYIKSLDNHHLVMDGGRGDHDEIAPSVQPGALDEPSIDIVTTHHYESDVNQIVGHIQANIADIRHKKAYVIGEFGFAPTAVNAAILDTVVGAKNDVAGALFWSLRFHDGDGGFYWHFEPFGGRLYKSLHWPGFASGASYDETGMLALMRMKAFEIRRLAEAPITKPKAPELLPFQSVGDITWRGAMGAASYSVERAIDPAGPWSVVASDVSDADVPHFPLFNDTGATLGGRYYYRVVARNAAGVSPPSNVVGPVRVAYKVKLDTMKDLSQAQSAKAVTAVMGDDRSFKEIRNRLAGEAGSELVYEVPGAFVSLSLYAFERSASSQLQLLGSADGKTWRPLAVAPETFSNGETNYDYWSPRLYHLTQKQAIRFLKIVFAGKAQLARVEIAYR